MPLLNTPSPSWVVPLVTECELAVHTHTIWSPALATSVESLKKLLETLTRRWPASAGTARHSARVAARHAARGRGCSTMSSVTGSAGFSDDRDGLPGRSRQTILPGAR